MSYALDRRFDLQSLPPVRWWRPGIRSACVLSRWLWAALCRHPGAGWLTTSCPASTSYYLVREIEARQGPFDTDFALYSVQMYDQTLPFYLRTAGYWWNAVSTNSLGSGCGTRQGVSNGSGLEKALGTERVTPSSLRAITRQIAAGGLPMRVLARDPRRVIVTADDRHHPTGLILAGVLLNATAQLLLQRPAPACSG